MVASLVACLKPEAHGSQRSPECTAMKTMKTIFSQNTVKLARKINLSFATVTSQIQQFRLNSYGCYRTTHGTLL